MSSQCCAPATQLCDICHQPIPKNVFEHTKKGDLDLPGCVVYTPCCDKTAHGSCYQASLIQQWMKTKLSAWKFCGEHVKCPFKCGFLADAILAWDSVKAAPYKPRQQDNDDDGSDADTVSTDIPSIFSGSVNSNSTASTAPAPVSAPAAASASAPARPSRPRSKRH